MMNLKTSVCSAFAASIVVIGLGQASAEEPDPEVMKLGKATYITCFACHNADGKGLPVGTMKMAPPLVNSPYVLGEPDLLSLIVLKGVKKEDAKWLGIMAPLETALDDKKLAAVLTYVRNSFGNKAPQVTEEQAKAARAKYAKIKGQVSRSTLEKLLAKAKAKKGAAGDAGAAPAAPAKKAATE